MYVLRFLQQDVHNLLRHWRQRRETYSPIVAGTGGTARVEAL
jgi:hypothetical protein